MQLPVPMWRRCRSPMSVVRRSLACLGLAIGLSVAPAAYATLVLDPIVTFEGRNRQAVMRVVNTDTRTMTYRIALVNLRKQANGSFVEAESAGPDDRFARDFIEFSPRQVTIAPNQTQTIRLILRKPPGLPPGEYRTFIRITELPPADNSGSGMNVTMNIAHQFPIIVRN